MTEKLDVIVQKWIESERGWGQRPDGCSLHLNSEDAKEHIQQYWDRMPDEVPDEYSKPSGSAYITSVSEELYTLIEESNNGIRLYQALMSKEGIGR